MADQDTPGQLSHVDPTAGPRMVDVGDKDVTRREAIARGRVVMSPETLQAIRDQATPKGDVLSVAQLAGVMAAKRTAELIPLCHTLPLSFVGVEVTPGEDGASVEIEATVRTTGQTGAEMEALTAVSVAGLTVYDMCKAIDRTMRVEAVRLVSKSGGRSGDIRSGGVDFSRFAVRVGWPGNEKGERSPEPLQHFPPRISEALRLIGLSGWGRPEANLDGFAALCVPRTETGRSLMTVGDVSTMRGRCQYDALSSLDTMH